jgi:hypothetical protein
MRRCVRTCRGRDDRRLRYWIHGPQS